MNLDPSAAGPQAEGWRAWLPSKGGLRDKLWYDLLKWALLVGCGGLAVAIWRSGLTMLALWGTLLAVAIVLFMSAVLREFRAARQSSTIPPALEHRLEELARNVQHLEDALECLTADLRAMVPQHPPLTSEGLDWSPVSKETRGDGVRIVCAVRAVADVPQPLHLVVRCSSIVDRLYVKPLGAGPQAANNRIVIGAAAAQDIEVTFRYPKLVDPVRLQIEVEKDRGDTSVVAVLRRREAAVAGPE